MIAYVPARLGSKRIKYKNIRKVNGKPLICYVIENLQKLKFIEKICVSTESKKIIKIIKHLNVVTNGLRSKKLADDKTNFIDLIKEDLGRFVDNIDDQDILFVLPTAILITQNIFRDAYNIYKKKKPDVLMSCTYNNPFFSLVLKKNNWKPLFKNKIHFNTQDLPKSIIDSGSFYFFNFKKIKKFDSLKNVKKLEPYILKNKNSLDLDYLEDFDELKFKASILYNT